MRGSGCRSPPVELRVQRSRVSARVQFQSCVAIPADAVFFEQNTGGIRRAGSGVADPHTSQIGAVTLQNVVRDAEIRDALEQSQVRAFDEVGVPDLVLG